MPIRGSSKSVAIDVEASKGDILVYDHKKKRWIARNSNDIEYIPGNKSHWQSQPGTISAAVDKVALGPGLGNHQGAATAYSLLQSDYILAVDTTNNVRVTLPDTTAVGDGKVYVVKDLTGNAGTKTITIARSGADTIEGATTKTISANYGSVTLFSSGAKWLVM